MEHKESRNGTQKYIDFFSQGQKKFNVEGIAISKIDK